MSPASPSSTVRVAAVQMVSTPRVAENLETAAALIEEAAATGARLIALPEYFCLMGLRDTDKVAAREPLGHGPIQDFLAAQARRHGVWLVGGTLPLDAPEPDRVLNSTLVFDPRGQRVARYDKVHLFRFTPRHRKLRRGADDRTGPRSRPLRAGHRRPRRLKSGFRSATTCGFRSCIARWASRT